MVVNSTVDFAVESSPRTIGSIVVSRRTVIESLRGARNSVEVVVILHTEKRKSYTLNRAVRASSLCVHRDRFDQDLPDRSIAHVVGANIAFWTILVRYAPWQALRAFTVEARRVRGILDVTNV